MATRSLTRLFINFRNSSVKNKTLHVRSVRKSISDDKVALVTDEDGGLLESNSGVEAPEWSNAVEEVQYVISKIEKQMKDLSAIHNKHLNRPSLDDTLDEEHTIDVTTQSITQLFHQCQRCIQSIQGRSQGANKSEQVMIRNVVSSLASQVQDLSQVFKKGQSTYLKRMKNREDREREYFDNDFKPTSSFMPEEDEHIFDEVYDQGFTTAQVQQLEGNTEIVKQREKEIQHIVQSIGDLNSIFKDLSIMVIDQGTILDRIDYNVEQASVQVEKGLEQLQKSQKHQKASKKMLLILILSVILIIMIIALVIVKK